MYKQFKGTNLVSVSPLSRFSGGLRDCVRPVSTRSAIVEINKGMQRRPGYPRTSPRIATPPTPYSTQYLRGYLDTYLRIQRYLRALTDIYIRILLYYSYTFISVYYRVISPAHPVVERACTELWWAASSYCYYWFSSWKNLL